jgi:hypothetical protein
VEMEGREETRHLAFYIGYTSLCREPVLKQGHGGQTAGLQNGLEFSNSVAVKKENVEALLAHVVGQLATDPCIHCRVGDGRFTACVIVAGVHRAMPACTNCHLSFWPTPTFSFSSPILPWDCSTGMPSTDSESEYLDPPHKYPESEVHEAAASDVTPPNTRKKRRLRYDDDIINGIKPESNGIVLMSPYLSMIDKSAS